MSSKNSTGQIWTHNHFCKALTTKLLAWSLTYKIVRSVPLEKTAPHWPWICVKIHTNQATDTTQIPTNLWQQMQPFECKIWARGRKEKCTQKLFSKFHWGFDLCCWQQLGLSHRQASSLLLLPALFPPLCNS